MIKVMPFKKDHLDLFEQRAEDIKRFGELTSDMENPLADYGTCFTATLDGRILLVGGILQVSKHTGKCWTMVSKHAEGNILRLIRAVKAQLENMMEDMKIHRIETANIATATEYHKWCRLLGFEEEGTMKYYDDERRDYIQFAKYLED